jgi:ABC-type phosphate transport system ATPase subunit
VTGDGPPLFDFENVSVRGDEGRWRLRGANGSIAAAGVTALLGPPGSGKSTLLRCCNRLEVPPKESYGFGVAPFPEQTPAKLAHAALDIISSR